MSRPVISVRGLGYRYGSREALRGLNLEVPEGSFFAILGPNGAGKSTLLRLLVGLIWSETGTVEVLGLPLGPQPVPAVLRARVGYVAQQPALYDQMTVGETIQLCRGVHPRWSDPTVNRYREMFGLPLSLRVRQMSVGMRSQLALALVMGGRPDLLILDEPTLGLDPLHRHQYLQVLLSDSMEAGRTVVISSHDLHQIERLADRVAILNRGRLAVQGLVDELKLTERRVRVAGHAEEAALRALPGVRRAVREHSGWLLHATTDPEMLRSLLEQVPGVAGVQFYEQSLEEIFLSYVG